MSTATKKAEEVKQQKEANLGNEIIAVVQPYQKGVLIEVGEIKDEAGYVQIIEVAKLAKSKMAEVNAFWDDDIKTAHKLHKSLIDKKKKFYAPLENLFNAIERRISQYRRKKEEERQQQEKILQQEALRSQQQVLTEEAVTLEKEGRTDEAALVLEEAMKVPAPVIQAPSLIPKVEGTWGRKTPWQFEIIAQDKVRDEYWTPDLEAIAAVVKAKGPLAENLIGKGSIRVWQDTKTVITGR